MKFNLKEEYKEADLTNIETLKQIVINKFKEYKLPLNKIIKKDDGMFIYGKYCTEHCRIVRKLVKEISNNEYLYERKKKYYNCNFIGTENLEEFQNILEMIISENLRRKEFKLYEKI